VPGLQWLGVVLASRIPTQGHPVLAAMRFWTTRAGQRRGPRDEETRLMRELAARFGKRVIHVFDRGFVGELGVRVCVVATSVRAIIRWTGKVHLLDEQGRCRPAWKAVIGKRQGQEQRRFWHARGHRLMRLRVGWAKVWHPSHLDHPLTLVVVRGYAQPWYLLTTEAVSGEEDAWQVALAYLQRWQLEQVWRLDKSELGFESVRIWAWEDRLKLLSMARLSHAFLLRLMEGGQIRELVRQWLLQHGCPRPGWHCRLTLLPISRLRAALGSALGPAVAHLGHPPTACALAGASIGARDGSGADLLAGLTASGLSCTAFLSQCAPACALGWDAVSTSLVCWLLFPHRSLALADQKAGFVLHKFALGETTLLLCW
jgi:hypothetical protein